ncbi:MAG TPA: hypothetical protein IGS52_06385 [Oscillatoriaceae cyanobacterium M33_DOE_052]|nr:hypothetical protein [Oscillatoriaceae cyanobacterium M33_DOE_052]
MEPIDFAPTDLLTTSEYSQCCLCDRNVPQYTLSPHSQHIPTGNKSINGHHPTQAIYTIALARSGRAIGHRSTTI